MVEKISVCANGIRMNLLREGEGPPPFLLHGWPEFSAVWRRLMPLLSSRYSVFTPASGGEIPNQGPSDKVTADVLADDIRALIEDLAIKETRRVRESRR
ncbi:hypothetical protein [Bradyrhizobium sp. AS23.2]|uniref:alpha/beta fold hydrolase n=1 Tax=Bradyrhizobium sp. AS23.2 TaxID=1680155 RepID=UPI00093E4BD3|nr:hypothetical protein [Bradyrhizobium sp. AS23.2]OKO84566.1 hypothetical protein AC630_08665 [Bradyrhizobium sp. AS23.2]